jgi:hypothetical protein
MMEVGDAPLLPSFLPSVLELLQEGGALWIQSREEGSGERAK